MDTVDILDPALGSGPSKAAFTRLVWLATLALAFTRFTSPAPADEKPKYDLTDVSLTVSIQPAEGRLEGTAEIGLTPRDSTNYIVFRLNGNLAVGLVADEEGKSLRYVQDDTDSFDVAVHFGRVLVPGQPVRVKIDFSGVLSRPEFDFYSGVGRDLYALIDQENVELPAGSFWFPSPSDPADRSRYETRVSLPAGFTPFTAGDLVESDLSGPVHSFLFRTPADAMPPPLIAKRFDIGKTEVGGVSFRTALVSEIPDLPALLKPPADFVLFLKKQFGFETGGAPLTLVEVSDKCREAFGLPGTVFITRKDLSVKANQLRVLARKIAYQKWLFPVRVASPEDLWIVEGLAQYTAALFYLENRGEEAFDGVMRILAVDALKFQDEDTVRKAYRLGIGSEKYDSVMVAKSAWIFHMLRYLAGRDTFDRILKETAQAGASAPLDTKKLIEITRSVTGNDLSWFFEQWVDTVDLPKFQVEYLVFRVASGGYRIQGKVEQNIAIFRMPMEIRLTGAKKEKEELKTVPLEGESTRFDFPLQERPQKVDLDPHFRILKKSKELDVQVNVVKGDESADLDEFIAAIDFYKRAIELDPKNSLVYYKMALVFYRQGNFNTALNTFRDALNMNQKPDWVVASCYLEIGKIFDILGQRERATAEYNKAVNTKDDSKGAVTEAQQHLKQPFKREKGAAGAQAENPAAGSDADDGQKPRPQP